jgi:tetratricopeptide (TPR) repeat protein
MLLCCCVSACSSSGEVTRLVRGQPVPGRYISVAAYASYARGAYLESHGDLQGAGVAYEQAARFDDRSAEVWTKIGDLRCRRGDRSAQAAYDEARRLDATYEPIWRSRAECELRRGAPRAALRHALHALTLDPNQEETSLLLVHIYERLGMTRDAERYLDGWVARAPRSVLALKTLLEFAHRHRGGARAEHAQAALRLLRSQRQDVLDLTRRDRFYDIDRALARGELARARELSVLASVTSGVLAVRAAALGASQLAARQAALVLAADPSDADARIALLVAADLSGDTPLFERGLTRAALDGPVPSALAARLMAELLARRVGAGAANAWLGAYGGLPAPRDALERALDARRLDAAE